MQFSPMIRGLVAEMHVDTIILFGSRARGDATARSDYDVLIVGDFKGPYLQRLEWVTRFLPDVAIDVFCYTPAEFETMFAEFGLTAIDAIGDGIPLHGHGFFAGYKTRHEDLVRRGMHKGACALYPPGK